MAIIDNFTKEELEQIVKDCTSYRELAKRLVTSLLEIMVKPFKTALINSISLPNILLVEQGDKKSVMKRTFFARIPRLLKPSYEDGMPRDNIPNISVLFVGYHQYGTVKSYL